MASVDFLHFCDHAFLDATGRPCLIGVMADLPASAFPFSYSAITVAIGVRLDAGEEATIRIELGPLDGEPARVTHFKLSGPALGGSLAEGMVFLPVQTVALFFDRAHILQVRVLEGDRLLASKALSITLKS